MNFLHRPGLVAFAVVMYCAWQSKGLLGGWRDAPFDRLGWLALVIWLLPLMWSWRDQTIRQKSEGVIALLLAGLALAFVGSLGEVNVLCYTGLACALAGTAPWRWANLPWLLAAISWMPAFGYFLSRPFPNLVLPGRICLALLAALWFWYVARHKPGQPA